MIQEKQSYFDVHAFTVAYKTFENFTFRKNIRNIFPTIFFGNQLIIDILGDLMFLVQVFPFVFDTDPTNHTFKKLWSREISDGFTLANFDQDFLIFLP